MPLPADVLEYCRIHARKCEDEGLHMRAIVLQEAAAEIERLRKRRAICRDAGCAWWMDELERLRKLMEQT